MAATVSIWKPFVALYGGQGSSAAWSPYIPLWWNPKLPELLSIPDFLFFNQILNPLVYGGYLLVV